jgi:DNA polymerase V
MGAWVNRGLVGRPTRPVGGSDMQRTIPITPATGDSSQSACDGSEAFALMVLGDAMVPEFAQGEVVVIEPSGRVEDGSFVPRR